MSRIMNDLREEHRSFGKLFSILERQMKLFQDDETPDYDLIGDVIELLFHFPHLYHHPKEDAIFEKLSQRDPSAASGLPDLKREHGKLNDLTQRFASNIGRVISEAEMPREEVIKNLRELTEFQRHHMQMEENMFFTTAEKSLMPDDWEALDARAGDLDDPTFGAEAKSEFLTHYQKILQSL